MPCGGRVRAAGARHRYPGRHGTMAVVSRRLLGLWDGARRGYPLSSAVPSRTSTLRLPPGWSAYLVVTADDLTQRFAGTVVVTAWSVLLLCGAGGPHRPASQALGRPSVADGFGGARTDSAATLAQVGRPQFTRA